MKKLYTLSLLLFTFGALQAQTFEWLATPAITFGANPEGIGYPTATDQEGNTFVCGFKDNATPYTDIFGNLWLLKYSASGQLLFSKTINGTVNAYKMTIDTAGNCYIVASYVDAIHFDFLNLTTNLQGVKPLLIKLDTDGNLLWYRTMTDPFVEHCKALTTDSQMNVYLGYDNFMDSYIERIDPEGNSLQVLTQTNAKSVSSIAVDTEGNIYATGSCAESQVNFNGTPMTNNLPYNTYLVKYDPYGQMQWMHFTEDVTCPEPQVLVRTPNEVYYSSYLFGNYTFGTHTTEGPVNGYSDFYLAKLNATGVYQWVKEVPGNGEVLLGNRNYLTMDATGNLYLAARTRGSIQWSPTVSTQSVNFNHDILVLKYNPQGNVLWAKMAGGTADDRTDGITVLADNSIILSGIVSGSATFDALTHTAQDFVYTPYVAKLSSGTLSTPTAVTSSVMVYPNPAQNTLTLSTPDYTGEAGLYTVLGQLLQKVKCTNTATVLDISSLPAGTYFIRLDNRQTLRFVKV